MSRHDHSTNHGSGPSAHPDDPHYILRSGWLRAAVLGANDGIVSVASLLAGIAASGADRHAVLLAGRLYDRPRLDALLDFTRAQARSPANAAKLVWGFLASSVSGEL